jgi:type VI secretion system secreted protein VgrG
MKYKYLVLSAVLAFAGLQAQASILGSAESYAVLGGSAVTNTGLSVITGSVGISPGSSVGGFPPGTLSGGAIHSNDANAIAAQVDLTTVYTGLAAMPVTLNETGIDLGTLTLPSGVYKFNTSAQLTGTLTLNAQGNNDAYWVFQIGSTLTTASASSVNVINLGSNGGKDDGVFWQVGSSATLGTTTAFEGNIVALTSITLNTGATDTNGRMLARNGAVTLDTNTVSIVCPNGGPGYSGGLQYDVHGNIVQIVPEPVTMTLVLIGGAILGLRRRTNVGKSG